MTNQVVAYQRRRLGTGEVLAEFPLDLPARQLRTRAVWLTLDERAVERAEVDDVELPGSLHAAEHAAIGLLPLLATCDRWDLGGLSTALHPDTGTATIFVYDGHPGGAGFSERGFAVLRRWLQATRATVASCECESGCPSCVQSPKCGNGNDPLDKAGAVRVLDVVLDELAAAEGPLDDDARREPAPNIAVETDRTGGRRARHPSSARRAACTAERPLPPAGAGPARARPVAERAPSAPSRTGTLTVTSTTASAPDRAAGQLGRVRRRHLRRGRRRRPDPRRRPAPAAARAARSAAAGRGAGRPPRRPTSTTADADHRQHAAERQHPDGGRPALARTAASSAHRPLRHAGLAAGRPPRPTPRRRSGTGPSGATSTGDGDPHLLAVARHRDRHPVRRRPPHERRAPSATSSPRAAARAPSRAASTQRSWAPTTVTAATAPARTSSSTGSTTAVSAVTIPASRRRRRPAAGAARSGQRREGGLDQVGQPGDDRARR